MVVQHVHFDGLGRTKDDIIICEIGDVFKAKNLIEVSLSSHGTLGLKLQRNLRLSPALPSL